MNLYVDKKDKYQVSSWIIPELMWCIIAGYSWFIPVSTEINLPFFAVRFIYLSNAFGAIDIVCCFVLLNSKVKTYSFRKRETFQ